MFSVREREKLLEQLRVEDGHQEVETGVVVGYDCEQGHLALPERRQVELVCGGERRQGVEVELLQLEASVTWMDLSVLAEPER